MEANVTKADGKYRVEITMTEEDFQSFMQLKDVQDVPQPSSGINTLGIFDSKEYCVTVCDMGARPFYSETIKTHPVWAYVRGYAIMKKQGGNGFQLREGRCS